jgi:hypothetical protein
MAKEHIEQCPAQYAGSAEYPSCQDGELTMLLGAGEKRLFEELFSALRTIPFGSIQLTIHEGRLVELTKTVRMRRV